MIRSLLEKADRLPHNDQLALERRVHQLAMDHIYQTIMLSQSSSQVNEELDRLKGLGLYPLPDRPYTPKYKGFSRLANSQAGLSLLIRLLPMLRKER